MSLVVSPLPRRVGAVLGLTVLAACGNRNPGTTPLVATSLAVESSSVSQTGTVGSALPSLISVLVTDQNGDPLPAVPVTWSVVDGSGSTSALSTPSDVSGTASVSWTLDTIPRVDSLTASIPTGASVTITATGTAADSTSASLKPR